LYLQAGASQTARTRQQRIAFSQEKGPGNFAFPKKNRVLSFFIPPPRPKKETASRFKDIHTTKSNPGGLKSAARIFTGPVLLERKRGII
jgi:hypothetical protein